MPTRLAEQTDGRKGNSDHIDVGRLDAGLLQTELGGLVGHAVLRMLVTHEALFFGGSDKLAVDV